MKENSITDNINYTEEWKKLPWQKFEVTLFRLQHRLYEASKKNNQKLCLTLQTYILKSNCSRYLAVRQITQLNTEKTFRGIEKRLDLQQKLGLVEKLKNIKGWKHQKLKRVYRTKANGQRCILRIPTLKDRAIQCLIKYAIEPIYESNASKSLFEFKSGPSAHTIQKIINLNLTSKSYNWSKPILKLNIEKFFDEINHDKLLKFILLPNFAKNILKQALKAGILDERLSIIERTSFFSILISIHSEVISPLLCNIALYGVEDLANEYEKYNVQRGFRYADDLVFFLKGTDPLLLRKKIIHFLSQRGFLTKGNEAKLITHLVHATQGFDFLGWNFKVITKTQKYRIQPSKKNYRKLVETVKATLKDNRFSYELRLKKIKIIYRGWRRYHQYCNMSKHNGWPLALWLNDYTKKVTKMKRAERNKWLQKIFTKHNCQVDG